MKMDRDLLKYLALLGNLGFIIIWNILISVILYKIYEWLFGFSSLVFIVLIILGVISGFYSIYKFIMK